MSEPFLPLFAPRVETVAARPIPVNWYVHLAPYLAEEERPAPPGMEKSEDVADDGSARRLRFGDVDEMARQERERQRQPTPEPPEIAQMRNDAQADAAQIVAQAQSDAESLRQSACEQGYQDGWAAGREAGWDEATRLATELAAQERQTLRDDVELLMQYVETERVQIWQAVEPQVIALVYELVGHIIKQEVEVSRDLVLSQIRSALRRVSDSGTLRIRVHPNDLETVRGQRETLLGLVDGVSHIEILEDRRIGAGGCVIETGAGTIDARLETQIAEMNNLLLPG